MDTRTDLRAMDLAAMDAAARDMGIVPGDTAYAFFMGMRRMLQEQHALLDKARRLLVNCRWRYGWRRSANIARWRSCLPQSQSCC